MNTRECLIIIKDKIKTSEVKKYQYNHDTQKMDITFQNGSVYSYLCDNVQVLKNPDILNPAMYHISRAGKTFFDISGMYVFHGAVDDYWHICFKDGSERDYNKKDLVIEESVLNDNRSANVFGYMKEIAGQIKMENEPSEEDLLKKNYSKITFIGKESALASYFGENRIEKSEKEYFPIFPFGCNNKVALLGIFGAILGYGGYAQKEWKKEKKGHPIEVDYPEFYEKLRHIKVSVVPKNERGYIPKKVQIFNNSVGYASAEQGGNLIIKEQWLENPVWDIYVLIDCEEAEKLAGFLQQGKCVYFPYLGKNDHPADITNVEKVVVEDTILKETVISSMFLKETGSLIMPDDEDDIEVFKYAEKLPVALNGYTNLYEYADICYTNMLVDINNDKLYDLYKTEGKVLEFY